MDDLGDPLVDPADDIALLCQVIATTTSTRITRALADQGFDDVRVAHGYVFQGLLAGDTTSAQLARRLGVSIQAVSKTVLELEAAGYLERRRDEHDGRARSIRLTRRARSMVQRSRAERATVQGEIAKRLGTADARQLARFLREVCELYGGLDAIGSRTVQPTEGLQ